MLLLALLASTVLAPKTDPLLSAFQNPPASARPHTWWHWMSGNVTKEGLTADLEAMKQAGIGGAQMFTVDQGIPAGPAGYMSPLWQDMITHAVKEANRLGIELCIHNCAGWSSSGGPWITPENAMQVVAWSQVNVVGPTHYSAELPRIKAPNVYANVDYRKDIAVYAFPTPSEGVTAKFDGAGRDDFLGRTGVIRMDNLEPRTEDKDPFGLALDPKKMIRLNVDADGKLDWDVPEGNWTILRMGHVPTGKDNHPAPPEGDGLEVDKLSRHALDTHWAGMMAQVIKNVGPLAGKTLNNSLIDSYEVHTQNWTPLMAEEFKKHRGYDMMPWLPVMAGYTVESRTKSERFLYDLRRTIADLFAENYFGYFGELCHKAGMKFSTEPYGDGGFDPITSGGTADIPMGEFWIGGLAMETTKVASSVGHIYGRPVIGAESFTADDVRGKWLEEPYGIKALGDLVFCNGINRYIFHRYAAQPWLDLKPGMTMGPWGTHLDRTQTWWTEAGTWLKYVARCQYLLQSGTFVADTLIYSGEHSPTNWVYNRGRDSRIAPGYDYDNCDATTLMKLKVKDGKLVLPSGMSYRVLELPESTYMTPKVATKIANLVQDGATVMGPKPKLSPSLTEYPVQDEETKLIGEQVWGSVDGKTVKENRFHAGHVIYGKTMTEVFNEMKISPDFSFKGLSGGSKLVSIHRRIGAADVYFVSNQDYRPTVADCTFRVAAKKPELWHGDSGIAENAPVYRRGTTNTTVTLDLGPAESVFVIFRHPDAGTHLSSFQANSVAQAAGKLPVVKIVGARYESADGRGVDVTEKVADMVKQGQLEIPATNDAYGDPVVNVPKRLVIEYTLNGAPMKKTVAENETAVIFAMPNVAADPAYSLSSRGESVAVTQWKPGVFSGRTSTGKTVWMKSPGAKSLDLSSGWQLYFPPNWGAPAMVDMPKLISWPDSDVDGVKYFSGSAVYTKTFNVPAGFAADQVWLSLGRVKNFATVTLNGVNLAVLWKEPYGLNVEKALRVGKNTLEIKVTNLWPNRIIGDEQLPEDVEWDGNHLKKWPDWLVNHQPRPQTGRYTFETWKFWSKDSPLLESGLLGPVVLKSAKTRVIKL